MYIFRGVNGMNSIVYTLTHFLACFDNWYSACDYGWRLFRCMRVCRFISENIHLYSPKMV